MAAPWAGFAAPREVLLQAVHAEWIGAARLGLYGRHHSRGGRPAGGLVRDQLTAKVSKVFRRVAGLLKEGVQHLVPHDAGVGYLTRG